MYIEKGDIWSIKCDALCIPTNGFVKKNGSCVMRRGLALQAATKYPDLPLNLGINLSLGKNIPYIIGSHNGASLLSFPVKPKMGKILLSQYSYMQKPDIFLFPGWACQAGLMIIRSSAEYLLEMTETLGWKKVLLPLVGCGNGGLRWEDVEPVISFLDERFIVVKK